MAGDEISSSAQYYYQAPVTNNNNSLVSDIVSSLIQAISGNAAASHATEAGTAGISSNLNASGGPLATIADPHQYTGDNIPRAYLNILFFDERFNFVGENSTLARVSQVGDGASPLVLANIKAPKNGYAYIYVSNESDQPVYFDNFKVAHNRGRIIEENHYYAYGLKIAGISSKKFDAGIEGSLKNNNLYNDKELWDDGDLNWYDYGFRNYDPQIGRFVQIDPLTDETPALSGYHYALNDPITNIDEDGLSALPLSSFCPGATWLTRAAANTVSMLGSISTITNIISIGTSVVKIGADYGQMRSTENQVGNLLNGKSVQQVGNTKDDFAKFTNTAFDLDGGRDAYRVDDEGTDFKYPNGKKGGVLKIKGKWQTQKNNPDKYLSPTAAIKNRNIPESANDPDRYYDPEKDAYIALNPKLKALHIQKYDQVEVTYTKDGKSTTITTIVGDDGPNDQDPNTLEMSPEAFRQLGITPKMTVPVRPNPSNGNKPYQNPKYMDAPENVELKVRKIKK